MHRYTRPAADDGTSTPSTRPRPPLREDPNAALTSQTLNADGTPKRPMNAFMIFARRRRPQVAAENQAMRTGDVSKILSREWNAMSMADKQFYLDQAKLLKDHFNQKYPDYVYKRRPNNSRKRRKADPPPGVPPDQASTPDLVDDYAGAADYSDVSPGDVADTDDPLQDVRYASLPADPPAGAYSTPQSRASSYQPSGSLADARGSYVSRPGRSTPDTGILPPLSSASRGSEHGTNYYHPYLPAQHHHHVPSSSYFAESADVWPGTRDDQRRIQMQSWPPGSQDLGGDDGYPQPVSSHGWTGAGRSEAFLSSGSSGASTASFGFPTLNSPFYPPPCGAQEGFPSSQHYGVVPPVPSSTVSARPYTSLQPCYTSASSAAVGAYPPHSRTLSLPLSSGQLVPSYPHVQPTETPASGPDPSQMRYWSRER